MNNNSITLTFDKSHIITIGKKMYKESINLIRELVNNAYDADATRVDIEITEDKLIVKDNGTGMNASELQRYFKIGSQHKKNKRSKIYNRKVIGEIGIGKFSSLGATHKFELITKQGNFKAKVVFDQNRWIQSGDNWEIPLDLLNYSEDEKDGTTVILYEVSQNFTTQEVADRLKKTIPLDAKNFEVFINNKKIEPIFIQGKKFEININTKYGKVEGNIIIANKSLPYNELGIRCCVKNVMITRNLFGFEDYGHGTRRITGKVNADFLDFTSDRDNFIINTNEYKEFYSAMNKEVKKVVDRLKNEDDEKKVTQSRKALSKATQILRKAFQKVPDYLSEIKTTVSKGHSGNGKEEEIEGYTWRPKKSKTNESETTIKNPKKEYNVVHINPITKNKSLKKIRTDLGFNFGFVEEGKEGPPSYYYNNTIYINREHQLYSKFSKNEDSEIKYLVDLLIAEAIMLTEPIDFRQYHERRINVLLKTLE